MIILKSLGTLPTMIEILKSLGTYKREKQNLKSLDTWITLIKRVKGFST